VFTQRRMALRLTGNHVADRIYGRAALGCTLVALLASAAPAAAQSSIEPNNGGATQYIPPAPEPGGDKPANPGAPGNPSALPPSTRAALPPGAEGDLLARIATSPGYGAPGAAKRGGHHGSGGGVRSGGKSARHAVREEGGSAVSAVAGAASDPGVAALVAALLALTLGTVAFARSRRRRGD
jgi:hypothetical protein